MARYTAAMNSINTLQSKIITGLDAINGVDAVEYSGQFSAQDMRRVLIKTPSILVDFAEAEVAQDAGTGQIDIDCLLAAYCITRLPNDNHNRNVGAKALAQEVALKVAFNRWGMTQVQTPTQIRIKPVNAAAFYNNALGVVAVSWRQIVRVGTSVWDGGVRPEEVWLGLSPEIGPAFVEKYQKVAP